MNLTPRWLRVLLARRLSRRGEHAAALAMSEMADLPVLSRAGMHLSVLRRAEGRSVERALALAHIGEHAEALEMTRGLTPSASSRPLFGVLTAQAPEDLVDRLPRRNGWTDLNAYCWARAGDFRRALQTLDTVSPLHGLYVALAARELDAARTFFARVYSEAGIAPPEVDFDEGRLHIDMLRGAGAPQPQASQPLISVILTAHNEENHLPVSVASILQQEWRNLELLIVDDGSTDDTLRVARELAERDARIRLLHSETNKGTWRAKNLALQQARGDFITMHDADDWSHPAKLALQVAPLLGNTELMCSSSYFFRVEEETGLPYTRNAASFLRWNPSSLLFRAGVLREIGEYQDLLGADCEFAERIELRWGVGSHAKLRKPLAIGLQRRSSLSTRFRHEQDSIRLRQWEQWRLDHVRQVMQRSGAAADAHETV